MRTTPTAFTTGPPRSSFPSLSSFHYSTDSHRQFLVKQVPVGTTMHPGREGGGGGGVCCCSLAGSMDGPHEAWACVIY